MSSEIASTSNTNKSDEDYELVIEGISQWLNNEPKKSEEFFKSNSDRTPILAGYAFVLCMVCFSKILHLFLVFRLLVGWPRGYINRSLC